MVCGLLGRTLGHSYSPQIHALLGDYTYRLFEKEPEEISNFLHSDDFTGINVTIPYKKAVIEYCDQLTPIAQRLGAVNTIVKQKDGTLLGHNTDYFGFRSTIERTGLCVSGKKALVLGSGGASATAVAVLEDLGANVIVISRSGENNYLNIAEHYDASLIVNATPVGMYPNTEASPLDLSPFSVLNGVIDLIYNPSRTALLQEAERCGIQAVNGLWMLVAQAKESAEYFMDCKLDDGRITDIYHILKAQMENILLIGMPGSGKSTIGKLLAKKLGRAFCDIDQEIVLSAGCSIPEIFEKQGEEGFRQIETAVLGNVCRESRLVIATGGGCVTKERNYKLLHQNSTIFWLKRNIEDLPTEGRPLSQQNKLTDMYKIRKPLYEAFADHIIHNSSTPEIVVDEIMRITKEDQ